MGQDLIRWQYQVIGLGTFNTPDRLAVTLAKLGSEGWELVHVYDKASNWIANTEKGFALFKRPVLPGELPDGPWAVWQRATATEPLPPLSPGTPEDWFSDPSGRHPDRWWDGKAWTKWVRDKAGGSRMEDPPII